MTSRLQRVCTLWVHEDAFSTEDVVFNRTLFPEGSFARDQLLKITPHHAVTSNREFGTKLRKETGERRPRNQDGATRKQRAEVLKEDGRVHDLDVRNEWFMFMLRDQGTEQKARHGNLQVSVCKRVAEVFGYKDRTSVLITTEEPARHTASFVELSFRDVYMTRADLRRMTSATLRDQALYTGQEINYFGIRFTVKAIYTKGQPVQSAFFSDETKPIFRSESARFVLYIQMSREMWEFETTQSGVVIADKLVNTYLPELFKRWSDLKARHLVSIVLFTRLEYDNEPHERQPEDGSTPFSSNRNAVRDFYRVVVSHMASGEGIKILSQLKQEIRTFQRDISTRSTKWHRDWESGTYSKNNEEEIIISGKPSLARHGNILEAINIVIAQNAQDYIDRDLVRTGLSVTVISPGTGHFEVEEDLLRLTTNNLITNGIGIDLVCLSPRPIHTVPVFQCPPSPKLAALSDPTAVPSSVSEGLSYADKANLHDTGLLDAPAATQPHRKDSRFFMPHWLETHHYQDPRDPENLTNKWVPTSRMYEMMMSGIMESEQSDILIPFLRKTQTQLDNDNEAEQTIVNKINEVAEMDEYDRKLFEVDPAEENVQSETIRRQSMHRQTSQRARLAENFPAGPSLISKTSPAAPLGTPSSFSRVSLGVFPSTSGPIIESPSTTGSRIHEDVAVTTPRLSEKKSVNTIRGSPGESPSIKAKRPAYRPYFLGQRGLSFGKALPTTASTHGPYEMTPINSPGQSLKHKASIEDSSPLASPRRITLTDSQAQNSFVAEAPDFAASPELKSLRATPRPIVGNNASPSKNESTSYRRRAQSIHKTQISPWLTTINPCKPEATDFEKVNRQNRWGNVHLEGPIKTFMNWKSLCTPASLPFITGYTPSEWELVHDFEESSYKVALAAGEIEEVYEMDRAKLMSDMVDFRLSKGFQVVDGIPYKAPIVSTFAGSIPVKFLLYTTMADEGATILLTKGDTIQILCGLGTEVHIKRYQRKATAQSAQNEGQIIYKPFLRTAFDSTYKQQDIVLSIKGEEPNWSAIDQHLAGWDNEHYSENLRFWRARFVLLPVEPSQNNRPNAVLAGDTDDEIRIEGLQKITQIWERNRHISPGERDAASETSARNLDPNPLGIEYQTRDASVVVSAGLEDTRLLGSEYRQTSTRIFSDPYAFKASDLDLRKIAHAIQGEEGIEMLDRRWFMTVHHNCFVAVEMVSWLLHNVKDITSRDQAVTLGQQLMDKGLFHHVSRKHPFRDGNYYFAISAPYGELRTDTRSRWPSRKTDKASTPSTPASDTVKEFHTPEKPRVKSSRERHPADNDANTPEKPPRRHTKVKLSTMLEYNVGIRKGSDRAELIRLHYDRLYNPDSCYHFRLEWLDANPKLIEDSITLWSSTAEKYGLKLVQVPIPEMRTISETNPFRSPYVVKLVPTPPLASEQVFEHHSAASNDSKQSFRYQRALLRKFEFVLDLEAASNFPSDVDVSFSWGQLDYKFTQYIHQSGTVMAQIDADGNLLFVANRLAASRASIVIGSASKVTVPEPEQIVSVLENFCKEEGKLAAFWEEASTAKGSQASTPMLGPRVAGLPAVE